MHTSTWRIATHCIATAAHALPRSRGHSCNCSGAAMNCSSHPKPDFRCRFPERQDAFQFGITSLPSLDRLWCRVAAGRSVQPDGAHGAASRACWLAQRASPDDGPLPLPAAPALRFLSLSCGPPAYGAEVNDSYPVNPLGQLTGEPVIVLLCCIAPIISCAKWLCF